MSTAAPPASRLRRWSVRLALGAGGLAGLALVAYGGLWFAAKDDLGARATGERRARLERSPAWQGSRFGNALKRVDGPPLSMAVAWFSGRSPDSTPAQAIETVPRRRADFETPPASGLRVTWLGHSTLVLELDGAKVLIDPVWGLRASPFTSLGPERWFPPPLPLAEVPAVDAVVLSHDHYDHLDAFTVRALAQRRLAWLVPLGLGAHLEAFGVAPADIVELDWWEEVKVAGLTVTATPARHFSGRWLGDQNQTLWAGWAFAGPAHRVFYSGDTALHPELSTIGEKLGPFDLTMLEVGAYNQLWADVHLGPEQAVRAHQLVRGEVMLPVHWGMFDLALHAWTEPIERVLVAAAKAGVRVAAPRPGEQVEPSLVPAAGAAPARWWPEVAWKKVEESPAWSSGVARLLEGTPGRLAAPPPR